MAVPGHDEESRHTTGDAVERHGRHRLDAGGLQLRRRARQERHRRPRMRLRWLRAARLEVSGWRVRVWSRHPALAATLMGPPPRPRSRARGRRGALLSMARRARRALVPLIGCSAWVVQRTPSQHHFVTHCFVR